MQIFKKERKSNSPKCVYVLTLKFENEKDRSISIPDDVFGIEIIMKFSICLGCMYIFDFMQEDDYKTIPYFDEIVAFYFPYEACFSEHELIYYDALGNVYDCEIEFDETMKKELIEFGVDENLIENGFII